MCCVKQRDTGSNGAECANDWHRDPWQRASDGHVYRLGLEWRGDHYRLHRDGEPGRSDGHGRLESDHGDRVGNGNGYTFTVHATNSVGNSAPSAASNSVTPSAPATVPGAPLIGTATAGNAQASVTFTAGATGGSAITGFTVTSAPGGLTGRPARPRRLSSPG